MVLTDGMPRWGLKESARRPVADLIAVANQGPPIWDPVIAAAGVRLPHVAGPRREDRYMVLGNFRNEIIGRGCPLVKYIQGLLIIGQQVGEVTPPILYYYLLRPALNIQ